MSTYRLIDEPKFHNGQTVETNATVVVLLKLSSTRDTGRQISSWRIIRSRIVRKIQKDVWILSCVLYVVHIFYIFICKLLCTLKDSNEDLILNKTKHTIL